MTVHLVHMYNTPPAKVRSTIIELGTGIFCEIDKETGNYVYEFENGRLYEFWKKLSIKTSIPSYFTFLIRDVCLKKRLFFDKSYKQPLTPPP